MEKRQHVAQSDKVAKSVGPIYKYVFAANGREIAAIVRAYAQGVHAAPHSGVASPHESERPDRPWRPDAAIGIMIRGDPASSPYARRRVANL